MNLLGRLALLFVVVPILELILLIQVGRWVGLLPTLLLVVATGVTGAWLARAEGVRVFFRFQEELGAGRLPGQALLDGFAVLVGGAFLLTPGILTDVAGFALLVPFSRRWIQKRLKRGLEAAIRDGSVRVVAMGPGGIWSTGGGEPAEEEETERVELGTRPGRPHGASRRPSDDGSDRGDPYDGRDPSKGIDVGGPSGSGRQG